MRLLALMISTVALLGCAATAPTQGPPQTVAQVDLQRYQGTWYEQARLPMFFQRHCAQSEAQYELRGDASIGVTNRCLTHEGEWQAVSGQAVAQVPGQTNKLWVSFDNWVSRLLPGLTKGEYWVLYLDADYQSALVGHPNRQYLWLLTRDEVASAQTRAILLDEARKRGYDTQQLIWRSVDSD